MDEMDEAADDASHYSNGRSSCRPSARSRRSEHGRRRRHAFRDDFWPARHHHRRPYHSTRDRFFRLTGAQGTGRAAATTGATSNKCRPGRFEKRCPRGKGIKVLRNIYVNNVNIINSLHVCIHASILCHNHAAASLQNRSPLQSHDEMNALTSPGNPPTCPGARRIPRPPPPQTSREVSFAARPSYTSRTALRIKRPLPRSNRTAGTAAVSCANLPPSSASQLANAPRR